MERERLIATLADFAGPLGPFQTCEELERRRQVWLDQLDDRETETLLSLLTDPPRPAEYRPASWEEFELDVTDSLIALGQRDPLQFMKLLGPLLENGRARPAIIEVIGALGLHEGIYWLKPLVSNPQLTTDELVRLACSLGEIGGPEARSLLKQMRALPGAANPELQREIEIALGTA
jgi:hypothetical protein